MDVTKTKKLLMIAYYFPPLGGSGALRPLRLAKYLPDYGWTPIVLTVKNPEWYYARDHELLKELKPSSQIIRSFMLRSTWLYRILNPLRIRSVDKILRRFVVQPDDALGWVPFAYIKGLEIIKRNQIDAIYSTSAPLSCHLIAYLISRTTKRPWIADFRDEWFENPDLNFPTWPHRMLHFNLERLIVRMSDKVIAPSPYFCTLLSKHGGDAGKFKTVLMGYDPQDFSQLQNTHNMYSRKAKFTLAFSGMFYSSFKPLCLLQAINELIEEGKIPIGKVKINFIGANSKKDLNFDDRFNICRYTGFVSHNKAVKHILEADILLLLLSKERGQDVIPSKTFEYMGSGKPILGLVPEKGEVARLIKEANAGVVVEFGNDELIKKAFLDLYRNWEAGINNFHPDIDKIASFNQLKIAGYFAQILNQATRN